MPNTNNVIPLVGIMDRIEEKWNKILERRSDAMYGGFDTWTYDCDLLLLAHIAGDGREIPTLIEYEKQRKNLTP